MSHASSSGLVAPPRTPSASPWPRTAMARRFGREILVLIVLKIVLLTLLWSVFIRPQHRADQTPQAIARHLVPTPAPSAPASRP